MRMPTSPWLGHGVPFPVQGILVLPMVEASVLGPRLRQMHSYNSKALSKKQLRANCEWMGIEVKSEKDHVDEIEEALALASWEMQRGSYGTGVLIIKKMTQYCSTKSKLGMKVFLELAMVYEAEGTADKVLGFI